MRGNANKKKAFVVCGPTASGKSPLSDALAGWLGGARGGGGGEVRTLAVDSMQVYREIPTITNQARRRPAELVAIVSVTEEWTVAHHSARAQEIISHLDGPFVLDAGTGMYLNAILLDFPLAPKVDARTRRIAEGITSGATNHRRASRAKELELAGVPQPGSVWEGSLRYDTALIYARPQRETLDAAIAKRSETITRKGLEEAEHVRQMREAGIRVNPSVLDSIGVRELISHLSGEITLYEAQTHIATRTRQLARRQVRWFDKLARALRGRASRIEIVENQMDLTTMHDRIWA